MTVNIGTITTMANCSVTSISQHRRFSFKAWLSFIALNAVLTNGALVCSRSLRADADYFTNSLFLSPTHQCLILTFQFVLVKQTLVPNKDKKAVKTSSVYPIKVKKVFNSKMFQIILFSPHTLSPFDDDGCTTHSTAGSHCVHHVWAHHLKSSISLFVKIDNTNEQTLELLLLQMLLAYISLNVESVKGSFCSSLLGSVMTH